LFLGAQKFGGKKSRRKACLSLEGERYQYQRFISYLVGVDPAAHFNQPEEALGVEALCLELGNKDGLQASYGNQAVILQASGRLEEAMALQKKQEALCRELGNKDGLQASYGNQALIVKAWGWLEEALELHKKKEALCIEVGNRSSLAYCYWNWGLLAREQRDRNTEREKLTAALKFSPI
jgi:tetratricopeptide (TPR) repeat protein